MLVASLDVRGCYAALAAHASQLVWFRRLFVVFSAYTYANRLVVIEEMFLGNHPVVLTNRHLSRIRSALITRAAAPNHS